MSRNSPTASPPGSIAFQTLREQRRWTAAYWTVQVLGWGTYVAAGLAMILPQTGPQPAVIGGYTLFFFYSLALSHLLRRLIRRGDWLALTPGKAAVRLFLAALVLGLVESGLIILVQCVWTRTSPFAIRHDFLLSMWVSTTAAAFFWTAGYTGCAALIRSRRARQNAFALELSMRDARLQALEAQLAPHFLFNCLNSLRGMIVENPAQAQDMVTRLANILRHNLLRDSSPSQTLGEQIEFTTDYLALETVRFDERLRTSFAIAPETRRCVIPAMLLQTLVENAIKHGIAHLDSGGEIAIRSRFENEVLILEVENTGTLNPAATSSTRVGLKNLRERLRVLHGPEATLQLAETGRGKVCALACIPNMNLRRELSPLITS